MISQREGGHERMKRQDKEEGGEKGWRREGREKRKRLETEVQAESIQIGLDNHGSHRSV